MTKATPGVRRRPPTARCRRTARSAPVGRRALVPPAFLLACSRAGRCKGPARKFGLRGCVVGHRGRAASRATSLRPHDSRPGGRGRSTAAPLRACCAADAASGTAAWDAAAARSLGGAQRQPDRRGQRTVAGAVLQPDLGASGNESARKAACSKLIILRRDAPVGRGRRSSSPAPGRAGCAEASDALAAVHAEHRTPPRGRPCRAAACASANIVTCRSDLPRWRRIAFATAVACAGTHVGSGRNLRIRSLVGEAGPLADGLGAGLGGSGIGRQVVAPQVAAGVCDLHRHWFPFFVVVDFGENGIPKFGCDTASARRAFLPGTGRNGWRHHQQDGAAPARWEALRRCALDAETRRRGDAEPSLRAIRRAARCAGRRNRPDAVASCFERVPRAAARSGRAWSVISLAGRSASRLPPPRPPRRAESGVAPAGGEHAVAQSTGTTRCARAHNASGSGALPQREWAQQRPRAAALFLLLDLRAVTRLLSRSLSPCPGASAESQVRSHRSLLRRRRPAGTISAAWSPAVRLATCRWVAAGAGGLRVRPAPVPRSRRCAQLGPVARRCAGARGGQLPGNLRWEDDVAFWADSARVRANAGDATRRSGHRQAASACSASPAVVAGEPA